MKAWCFWLTTTGFCVLLAPVFAIGLLFTPRSDDLAGADRSGR